MVQETIKCPKCGEIIKISQAISQDIEAEVKKMYEIEMNKKLDEKAKEFEIKAKKEAEMVTSIKISAMEKQLEEKNKILEEIKGKESEIQKREVEIKTKEQKLKKDFELRENELKQKMDFEKKSIAEKLRKELEEAQKIEIFDIKNQLAEKTKKLEKAEQQELELRRKQRELEEKEKTMELEIIRKIDDEKQKIIEKFSKELEEKHRLKDAEKEKQLTDMKNQIEILQRKAEQGSQQTQGEVLELELEQLLKSEFPFDEIEPVSKGVRGGDVIQTVKTQSGKICGKILWETKRTKSWSDGWIQKVKDDQREIKADIAVIVSEALPKGFHHFRQLESVWVTDIPSYLSLSVALRVVLIQTERTRDIQIGKEQKMEVMYSYFTGTEFRNRVQAIVEALVGLKKDLDAEKRSMEKVWAKREKQIEKVLFNFSGMHGDIEGIAGTSLPSIKLLELPSDNNVEGKI